MSDVSIQPLEPGSVEEFIVYLNGHLSDNGAGDMPCFQPLPKGSTLLVADHGESFANGMRIPVGEPGWRRVWVARSEGGNIVGHVDLRSRGEQFTAHRCLLGMGVDRGSRRQGLGARLIGHAQRWAEGETAIEWIDLQVISLNEPAVRLYLREGFCIAGEMPDLFRIDGRRLGYTYMYKRIR